MTTTTTFVRTATTARGGVPDALQWFGMVHIYGQRDITVTGMEITNVHEQGIYLNECSDITIEGNLISAADQNGIMVCNSTGVEVSGNTITDLSGEAAIWIESCVGSEIPGNVRDDPEQPGPVGSPFGILVIGLSSDVGITENRAATTVGTAIQLLSIGGPLHHVEVRDNTIPAAGCGIEVGMVNWNEGHLVVHDVTIAVNWISNVAGEAISAGAGSSALEGVDVIADWGPRVLDDVEISNNLILDSSEAGIRIMEWHTELEGWPTLANCVVVNNTVSNYGAGDYGYGPAEVGHWGGGNPHDSEPGITVRNNLLEGSGFFPLAVSFASVVVDHNLFTDYVGEYYLETHRADAVETADPGFADAGDYSITALSPARDAGSGALAPSVDILGTVRPQGAALDIGAFEYAE